MSGDDVEDGDAVDDSSRYDRGNNSLKRKRPVDGVKQDLSPYMPADERDKLSKFVNTNKRSRSKAFDQNMIRIIQSDRSDTRKIGIPDAKSSHDKIMKHVNTSNQREFKKVAQPVVKAAPHKGSDVAAPVTTETIANGKDWKSVS